MYISTHALRFITRKTVIAGACFGSRDRCSISDAMDRSGMLLAPSTQLARAPSFDPIAMLQQLCQTMLQQHSLGVLSDANAESILVSISRMILSIASDSIARDRYAS